MKVEKASYQILTQIDGDKILRNIENISRTCYKSHDRINQDSHKKLVKSLVKNGHHAMIEHESVTVKFVTDRGISHELVRHRIASFAQESTRYCSYNDHLVFISPFDSCFKNNYVKQYTSWLNVMQIAEITYQQMLRNGATPQEARSVLPNSLKTEIIVTMNLRSWRNFFQLRADYHAHPQMREIAVPLLAEFKQLIPIVFDDIGGAK